MRLVSVAVPIPFLDALTYTVPEAWPMPHVGARVLVSVGNRRVTGCVIEPLPSTGRSGIAPDDGPAEPTLKPLLAVIDDRSFVPPAVIGLCGWVADYYLAGIGDALTAALPPGARDEEVATGRRGGFRQQRVAALTTHGASVLQMRLAGAATGPPVTASVATLTHAVDEDSDGGVRLTARQRGVLEMLAAVPAGIAVPDLRDRGVTADALNRLARKGLVALRRETADRDPFEGSGAVLPATLDPARVLTSEQARTYESLAAHCDRQQFHVALLHGVTGSGKSEIYLRLAAHVRRAGRTALLLVPEIALTPAVAGLFRQVFGTRVAIQHSALSAGERHDQWHRIRRGEVDVVVGTRSAVFAPLANVGLIVVDEEHDGSYKQEEAPRYHGRDVAVVRGSREGALVLLGSATPAMESYQNAETGKYSRETLQRRVLDRPLADVRIVNMREEYAEEGPDVVISRPLAEGIRERLDRGEQVVVLLNRRGYATAVFCRQCGDTFDCPNCSVSLTVHTQKRPAGEVRHRVEGRARCHYCNFAMRIPTQCRKCAAPYLEQTGFGTERVEEQLTQLFPQARIARVDRDSTRRRGALASMLGRFAEGAIDLLVGTQMIAKGHDFPRVTLVGVISADVGLGMADFRASERTFQLLTQVAGRAGRGDRRGEAIVQTLYPEHYSIQLACRQDYVSFFAKELQYRRSMLYPPVVAMINIIVRGRDLSEAMQLGGELASRLMPALAALNVRLLGPAPAPFVRLRGEHRVQLFLKGTRRAEMRGALREVLAGMPEARRRVTVDVDPLNVL